MSEAQGFVCIGASAGGLRSIEAVLRGLDPALAWPVLVSQHMNADHPSQLAIILARSSRLPVREAADGDFPLAGCVYVGPSGSELGVTPEGRLALRQPHPGRPQRIDHLFSTAAFSRPGSVVAVVLSGTGTDGAGGALVVKLTGGTVIAESDGSAQHAGMPDAAQRAGAVDGVRPAEEMGPVVSRLANGALAEASETTDRTVRGIAATLARHTRTEFEGYRVATLRRRVEKRRAMNGATSLEEYAGIVERDSQEREALVNGLLIPVTEFFRDPAAWQSLVQDVLPGLVQRANEGERVRAWCAGCASGEEAFSLAILLAEGVREAGVVEIVATDLHSGVIEHARRGVYAASRFREVSPERLARFFTTNGDEHRVSDDLRSMVRFEVQDLTRESPPGLFDLIVCRNVLIYFEEPLQSRVLGRLRAALRPDGTLFLGRSETIPGNVKAFAPKGPRQQIFRAGAFEHDEASREVEPPRTAGHRSQSVSDVSAVLLGDSDAIFLVVDASWRVMSANERAERALGAKSAGANLFDLLPAWRDSPVHDALLESLRERRSVRVVGAPSPLGPLELTVERFPPGADTLLLVAHVTRPVATRPAGGSTPGSITAANEELAATNDELAAANEELAAANEELQASNEELASLNEEFQSTNETLAATNTGLRAGENGMHAGLLRALLVRSAEALVVCDREQVVVAFNAPAALLLGLAQSEVGKPFELPGDGGGEVLRTWMRERAASAVPEDRSLGRWRLRVETLTWEGRVVGSLVACRAATS